MNIALKWGMIGSAIFIIYGLAQYLMGPIFNQGLSTVVSLAVLTGVIVMAIKTYKDETGGYATYGQGLGAGLLTSLVIGVITLVWTFLLYDVIAPDFKETILEVATDRMREKQGMDDDQIEQIMEQAAFFFSTTWFAIVGLVGTVIMGLIISLITAAIMKNDPPEHEVLDAV